MNEQVITQFVLAYIGTRLVQWMKAAAGLPWITAQTDTINKGVGALVAFLATLGIGLATSWDASTGTFVLTITGLSLGTLTTFVWHWFSQFVMQQAAYHAIVKPEADRK
jgi:protein-S-isoprenylcysteine O-methyltransferase Ste14